MVTALIVSAVLLPGENNAGKSDMFVKFPESNQYDRYMCQT